MVLKIMVLKGNTKIIKGMTSFLKTIVVLRRLLKYRPGDLGIAF
jgi:hypothetical protein